MYIPSRARFMLFVSMVVLFITMAFFIASPNVMRAAASNGSIVYTPASSNPDPGSAYPRFIRLSYSGSLNGTLLATFEDYQNPTTPFFPIYRSTDNGASWSYYSQINDTHHNPAWGMRWEPKLYELPQQVGSWPAGTILAAGNSIPSNHSQTELDLYASTNHGLSWSYVSMIVAGGAPVTSGSSPVWEPELQVDAHGNLVAYYSDERHKANGYNQLLAHEVSTNGGKTWGGEVYDVAVNNGSARPGMAVVTRMGNGQYAMSFEVCGANPNCGVHVKISSDGDNWGNASDLGSLVQSSNGTYLCCTPYNAWVATGGNGTLYVSGKMEYNSNGSVASGSGSTLMANYNYGSGAWYPVNAPLHFTPIASGCNGWSQPLVAVGTTLMQMPSTALPGSTTRCEIRFASESVGSTGGGFTPNPASHYKIVNRNSGQVLDVNGWSTTNGGIIDQYTDNGGANQQWSFVSTNGGYKLVNVHSGLVLDDPAGSKTNGTQLDQWNDTNGSNQWWNVVSAGNGYYFLVNQSSGQYADVTNASTTAGAAVIQWTGPGGTNQQWSLVQVS